MLPLLNGVESVERIKNILLQSTVWEGSVYIVSELKAPGIIENSGSIQKLAFGLDNTTNTRLSSLEKIFQDAGIDTILSDKISTIIWGKFIFIAAVATATSYFDCSVGKILEENSNVLLQLISWIIRNMLTPSGGKNPE